MDRKHLILSILLLLPFLGLEMSPLGSSWIVSSIIWAAFIVLLAIYNKQFIRQIRIRSPIMLANSNRKYEPKSAPSTAGTINEKQPETYLSWLTAVYESDKVNLKTLLKVQNVSISDQSSPTMGGYIEFIFDVFNASIMAVKVASEIDGYIVFQGIAFYDKPEPVSPYSIPHAEMSRIMIRQRILPEVAKVIDDGANTEDGITISFNFRNVRILIEEDIAIGKGASSILKIPEVVECHVKESSQRGHPYHRWECK